MGPITLLTTDLVVVVRWAVVEAVEAVIGGHLRGIRDKLALCASA